MSRHPKIQYVSLNESDISSLRYQTIIDRLEENGCFNMLAVSSWTMNLWDISYKKSIKDVVEYAKSRKFDVCLQVFPKGFRVRSSVDVDNAAAIVTEYECAVENEHTIIRAVGKNVRYLEVCNSIQSELLSAYAFRKCGNGFYEADSVINITDKACIIYQGPDCLTLDFDTTGLEGYNIYVMVAHYYAYITCLAIL